VRGLRIPQEDYEAIERDLLSTGSSERTVSEWIRAAIKERLEKR
jgi:hypothetical protein